jgi:hypothetical protein
VTIPASGPFPDNTFDHIFTAGLGEPKATVKAFPEISDHNAVLLDLDLTKAAFQPQLKRAPAESMLAVPAVQAKTRPATVTRTLMTNEHAALRPPLVSASPCRGRSTTSAQHRMAAFNSSTSLATNAGNSSPSCGKSTRKRSPQLLAET